jgi:hypothetical protein
MVENVNQYRMPRSVPQVPCLFSSYIDEHFKKAFIWGINTVIDSKGDFVYKVELSDAHFLYHLQFNLDGALIGQEEESML